MGIYWGFPKIRGTIIVFWGLYWGPPIIGNYHFLDPPGVWPAGEDIVAESKLSKLKRS